MTDIRAAYERIGADFDDAAGRFGSPALVERFAGMFVQDKSFDELEKALTAHDAKAAFRAVHTLKGVALNLGLGSLAHASSQMTEALRGQDSMPESVQPLYVAVQKEHTAVCSALEQLEK